MDSYLNTDGLRAALVVTLALGQAVMAYWPDLRRWNHTIASRSAKQQVAIVPSGWAFAIWGLIFTGCIAFSVWQALPGQLGDPLLRQLGWLAAAVFGLNIAWAYWVPKHDIGWPSVAIIVLSLVLLLNIVFGIAAAGPLQGAHFWLMGAPFQLYAGWITAATFVNTASTLKRSGVPFRTALSLIFLVAAAALGVAVAYSTGSIVYAGAIAWALFGIVGANVARNADQAVAFAAGLAAVPVVAAALAGG